jgi:hypothetical protein
MLLIIIFNKTVVIIFKKAVRQNCQSMEATLLKSNSFPAKETSF